MHLQEPMARIIETDSTLDCAARAREFQLDGFIVLRQFFSPAQVVQMRRRVEDFVKFRVDSLLDEDVIRSDKGSRGIVILGKLDRRDDYFAELASSQRLVGTARRLLGADIIPSHVDFINKHRDAPVTQPHQDAYIFTRFPSESLTCWIPLDRIEKENGCLCYVRGSHWGGYRPHDLRPRPNKLVQYTDGEQEREVAAEAAPGDLLVHHSFTVHHSAENQSGRPRWALAIPYVRSGSEVISKRKWLALHEGRNSVN